MASLSTAFLMWYYTHCLSHYTLAAAAADDDDDFDTGNNLHGSTVRSYYYLYSW